MVAAAAEARAILAGFGSGAPVPDVWTWIALGGGFDLLLSGVGKANAAGATAHAMARTSPSRVLNLGICGALPHTEPLRIGEAVLATSCVLVDEGVETPSGWIPLAKAGFPAAIDADSVLPDAAFNRMLRPLADRAGVIATVSSCSGSDARAEEVHRRCSLEGLAEAMEGAAVGLASTRQGTPFAELRVVSNRTGDRESQGWDLARALARLQTIARQLALGIGTQLVV